MRAYTTFCAAAILALANLIAACESEIVTVTTEKVVVQTEKVYVCADDTEANDPRSCPPGPVIKMAQEMDPPIFFFHIDPVPIAPIVVTHDPSADFCGHNMQDQLQCDAIMDYDIQGVIPPK